MTNTKSEVFTPSLIIVQNDKGGMGKSTVAKQTFETAVEKFGSDHVILADCDHNNNSSYRSYEGSGHQVFQVDLRETSDKKTLLNYATKYQGKIIILDMPAGDVDNITQLSENLNDIEVFINAFKRKGFKVKVVIPVLAGDCSNLPDHYDIYQDLVEYFIVKNMRGSKKEENYSEDWKSFEVNARPFAESTLGIDTLVQAPDPANKNPSKTVLIGYTKNCILMSPLGAAILEQFMNEVGRTNPDGKKTILPPISLDNIEKVEDFITQNSLFAFHSAMANRISKSDLFY